MKIEFKNISKRFGSRVVLSNLSFVVPSGSVCFILGKSGTGKSVCLKHIVGLIVPDSGTLFINDRNFEEIEGNELNQHRQKCSFVFQHPALFDSLTLGENIAFGLNEQRKKGKNTFVDAQIRMKILEYMRWVQLEEKDLNKDISHLSYGMLKRGSIARALSMEPQAMLFDEPTTGLDSENSTSIGDLIFRLSRELKMTCLVVSHDIESALKYGDSILLLDEGRKVFFGIPGDFRKSKEPLVQSFLENISESASSRSSNLDITL